MAVNKSSPIRLMGMSSGLDTESIIQQTMKLHQLKIDSKNRSKTLLEWKQKALTGVKDDITNFRRTFLSALSAKNMRSTSVYNASVASLSGGGSNAVSVSTTISSSLGSFTIGKVSSLAKGATVKSADDASHSGDGFKSSEKLKDMVFADGSEDGGKLTFDADGKTTVTINNVDIELSEDDTLDSMLKKVNSSGANVTMSYDRLNDKFTLASKKIGGDSQLTLGDGSDEGQLGLFGFSNANVEAGSKAVVTINGKEVTSDSNTIDYRGVKITLNKETDEETEVTIKRDVSGAMDTIKGFVESYNALIKKLEDMLKERKTSTEAGYTPLTDEEKSAMTEKQIEDWEAIAKKGLLRNDSGIQSLVTSLRSALFDTVEGAGLKPSDIGLTTGSYYDGTGGQIIINEDKLRAALEKDPEQVMGVFMNASSSANASTKYKESGLLNRMDDIMAKYLSGSQKNTMNNLEDSLRRANEQIDALQTKMYKEEETLYKKYAAMETALASVQSQGDWLSAMLGSM